MTYAVPMMKQEGTVKLASRCFEILCMDWGQDSQKSSMENWQMVTPELRATLTDF